MYFDNYVKPNPSTVGPRFHQSSVSVFHQQSVNGFEPIQFNQRAYFNPRLGENTTVPSPGVNKNIEQQPKQFIPYQTGPTHSHIQRQQSFQVKNNILFTNEQPTSVNNRQTGELMRRRDSITQNTFLRSNQGHSPSNNKSFVGENGKSSLRMTMNNEQQRSMQIGQKNNGSFSSVSGIGSTGFSEQDYGMNLLLNREQKDKIQEKGQDKSGYFTQSNYSQYGFSQSKVGSKPYALGFKSGVQADLTSHKTLQPHGKQKPLQQKQHLYNYQLKNTTSELTSFSKTSTLANDQFKYYTPSLAKKSSLKDDSGVLGKNGYSQLVDVRHQNNMLERQQNYHNAKENNSILTDREIYKSPSFDALLSENNKDGGRGKLQSTIEGNYQQQYASSNAMNLQNNSKQSSQQNITPRNHTSNTTIDNQPYTTGSKPSSQSFLQDPVTQKLPKQSTKNYRALIQNLEKKFSEQKKSTQSFQNKQKHYLTEIHKRDEKIKRLETIVDNNKETIAALDSTIKQLRRKHDSIKDQTISKTETSNSSNIAMIEQLKRENGGLKQELKKQRKKSVSISEQTFQKQIFQRQQLKIKQLQKALIEANNNRQTISQQLAKLKDPKTSIQQNYCQQIKQHQKAKYQLKQLYKLKDQLKEYQGVKDELLKTKQQTQQLTCIYKEKVESFNQVKAMLQNLEQKYQGALKKIVCLEEKIDEEGGKLRERLEVERKEKILLVEQNQKYKQRLQRLNGEIDFKSMKIKTLQDKISEKQSQLQATISAHHKAICNNELSVNQTISICIEETKMAKQKLSLKQQAYEALSVQMSNKCRQIELLRKENGNYQNRIVSLESQIKGLELIVAQNENKIDENPKTTSDSAEIKTLSSESGKESPQFKEILSLLELYHQKYTQIVGLFSLNQPGQQKLSNNQQSESLTLMQQQSSQTLENSSKPQPSRQYINQYHPLVADEVKKVLKDMKKLVNVLKQCQTDSQLKTQRLHELDKTFKKQANKINQLLGEIHLKNMTIVEINHMQVEKDIFRLNEKYQILNHVGLGEA